MVPKQLLLLVCCVAVGVSGQEGVVAEVCFQPSETGPCRASLPAYFFNTTSGVCECFMFGGCGGKGNIFLTVQECVDTCAVPQHLQDQVEGCQSELTGDVATTELAPLDSGTGATEAEVTTLIPVVDAQPTDVTQTEEAVTQIPEETVTSAPVTETQEYVTSTSVVESETTEINPVQDPEPAVVTSTSVVDTQVTEVSQTQEAGATQTQDIITEVPQAQNEVTEVPQTTTVSLETASSTPDSTTDSTTDSTSASTSASTPASTAASTTATATTNTSPSTTASTTATVTANTSPSTTSSTTSRPATTTSRPATTSSTTARPARTTSPIFTVLGPGVPVRQVQGVVMGSHGSRPGLLALGQPVFPFRPRA